MWEQGIEIQFSLKEQKEAVGPCGKLPPACEFSVWCIIREIDIQ
jgi:hypothetical protein